MRGIQINNYFNNHITLNGKKVNHEPQQITEKPKTKHFTHSIPETDSSRCSFIQMFWNSNQPQPRAVNSHPRKEPIPWFNWKSKCLQSDLSRLIAKETQPAPRKRRKLFHMILIKKKRHLQHFRIESSNLMHRKEGWERGANRPSSKLALYNSTKNIQPLKSKGERWQVTLLMSRSREKQPKGRNLQEQSREVKNSKRK